MGSIYNQIVVNTKGGRKQFALLVDPDKTDPLFLGKIAHAAQRSEVDLPLTSAVAAIATGELRPKLAFDALMRREARAE